jgi:radical SAM protein with 4Fe4S-binding SPASM domain
MTICGWAVVDRAWTGMGLIEDQSPVPMDPPRRPGKPNVQKTRLTVLADGTVTLCGQDWLGRVGLGNVNDARLSDLWRSSPALADQVMERPEADRPICRRCQDWLAAQDRKPVGV